MSRNYDHVEHPDAYRRAIDARIKANAATTRRRAFEAANPDHESLRLWLYDAAERGSKFGRDLLDALDQWGGLSDKQAAAVRNCIERDAAKKAEFKARDAASTHIGVVGARQQFAAVVSFVATFESAFGLMHVIGMRDAAGNVIIYKGGKRFADKGDSVEFSAGIKAHAERDGVAQTIITRPTKITISTPAAA